MCVWVSASVFMAMMVRLFEVFILVRMGETLTAILSIKMKIIGGPRFWGPRFIENLYGNL